MWVEGTVAGTYIRRSLQTKSWEKAVSKVRQLEAADDPNSASPEGRADHD